jgi:hypothetical protein
MNRFIEGADRAQSTLFPECLDDWIGDDNPVRAIDAFVDALDLTISRSSRRSPIADTTTARSEEMHDRQ